MISPAILACAPAGGGPAPYHAGAVHFDGATELDCASLVSTDNGFISFSLWCLFDVLNVYNSLWVSDPVNDYVGFFQPANTVPALRAGFSSGGSALTQSNISVSTGVWYNYIFSCQTNLGLGSKILKIYQNDVDITNSPVDFGASFIAATNGSPACIGGDTFGDNLTGDMTDVRVMPGVSLLDGGGDIPLATRRLFIDADGKPVDPAIATIALGAPCMLFSGDATAFGTNQGTGGAFTTTGTLTNASSSPSD